MTENDLTSSRIELQLNTDRLDECPAVRAFDIDLPRAATYISADGVGVSLHYRDDSAIILVDYRAGMGVEDTAFAGDIEDAHKAVCRLARHTDAEVIRDEFDVLTGDGSSHTRAGENE